MISTNSSGKFFPTVKNLFRRNIAYFVVSQLIVVLFSVSAVKPYFFNGVYDLTDLTGLVLAISFFGLLQGFILPLVLFKEIYSRRASDFFFSLPVKRSSYFNANVFFGLINTAVSYVIAVAVTVGGVLIKSAYLDYSKFFRIIAISFLASAATLVISSFFAVLSGRMWHYFLLEYVFVFELCFGVVGFACYLNTIWGMSINVNSSWMATPLGTLLIMIADVVNYNIWVTVSVLLAELLLAYIAGLIVLKRRKAEVAESSFSEKLAPAVTVTVWMLSAAFLILSIYDINFYIRVAAVIFAAVVIAIFSSLILYRKALTKTVVKCACAALAISAITVLCVEKPPEKFIQYVPEPSEVEYVTMSVSNREGDMMSITDILYGASPFLTDIYGDEGVYKFSGENSKELVESLHYKMISDSVRNNDTRYYNIKLSYNLKNGKRASRSYTVSSDDIYKELAALLKSDEGISQLPDFELPDNILFAELDLSFPEAFTYKSQPAEDISYFRLDDYSELIESVKKDRQNYSETLFFTYSDIDFGYIEDCVSTCAGFITLNFLAEDIPEEEKNKILGMSPEEAVEYQEEYFDKKLDFLFNTKTYVILATDYEALNYLEKLGYSFDKAEFDRLYAIDSSDTETVE